jgi:hypothetical protein
MFRMSSFPPKKWEVRFLKDMESMRGADADDNTVRLDTFMAVRPSAGEEGSYLFKLSGTAPLKLSLNAEHILAHDHFRGMRIEAQLELGTQVTMI